MGSPGTSHRLSPYGGSTQPTLKSGANERFAALAAFLTQNPLAGGASSAAILYIGDAQSQGTTTALARYNHLGLGRSAFAVNFRPMPDLALTLPGVTCIEGDFNEVLRTWQGAPLAAVFADFCGWWSPAVVEALEAAVAANKVYETLVLYVTVCGRNSAGVRDAVPGPIEEAMGKAGYHLGHFDVVGYKGAMYLFSFLFARDPDAPSARIPRIMLDHGDRLDQLKQPPPDEAWEAQFALAE
jgi:hypothetical protein